MLVPVILGVSTLLQFGAAALALLLVRFTKARQGWIFVAVAMVLMGIRRTISLHHMLAGGTVTTADLPTELVALTISVLMFVGVLSLAAVFRAAARTRQAEREKEQIAVTMYENSPLGYQSLDEEGRFLHVNPAWLELTGYGRDEVIGRSFADFLVPEKRETFKERFPIFKESGHISNVEFDVVAKDTTVIPASFDGRIELDELGRFVRTHCVVHDIRQQKQAEATRLRLVQRLENYQRQAALARLAGGVAHHFNNLLHSILGFAELGLQDPSSSSSARDCFQMIREGAEEASTLSLQLLACSGHGVYEHQKVQVPCLVEESVPLLETLLGPPHQLMTQCEVPRNSTVYASQVQLRQILINLVQNAVEAMSADGGIITLRITTRTIEEEQAEALHWSNRLEAGRYLCLEIEDTGRGIDEETLRHVYDPFFSTKGVGRGLGVPAVAGIVHTWSGAMHIDSQPGAGTCVRILLPETKLDEGSMLKTSGRARTLHKKLVLLVEDDSAVAKVCQRMLARLGFSVTIAETVDAARASLPERLDDLACVILAATFPQDGPVEMAKAVRQKNPKIPLIIASGSARDSVRRHLDDRLFDAFLRKPYGIDELEDVLDAVL